MSKQHTGSALTELLAQRVKLQEELSHLDSRIISTLNDESARTYIEVTGDSMPSIIDSNLNGLGVIEAMSIAGVSSETYYRIRNRVSSASVGKVSALLSVLGLSLYVGKKSKSGTKL